jgi:hypothetical protein
MSSRVKIQIEEVKGRVMITSTPTMKDIVNDCQNLTGVANEYIYALAMMNKALEMSKGAREGKDPILWMPGKN